MPYDHQGIQAAVHSIEDHDEALYLWSDLGLRRRALLHLDAHADYFPTRFVDVGSFVYHAHTRGVVDPLYWVIPEPRPQQPTQGLHAKTYLDRQGLLVESVDINLGTVVGNLGELRVWLGSVAALPAVTGPVLLDVDTDYFTLPRVSERHVQGLLPWQLPDQLVAVLTEKGVTWDVATVCTSVRGGYNPVEWRCLTPYTSELLRTGQAAFSLAALIAGAAHYCTRSRDAARLSFERALYQATHPAELAALHWWLARLAAERLDVEVAREHLASAIKLDSACDKTWICPGFAELLYGSRVSAAHHFAVWQPIFDNEPRLYAAWGLAVGTRNRRLARELCKRALHMDKRLPDAHLCLGKIAAASGQWIEAARQLDRAMVLTQAGAPSLMDPVRCSSSENVVNVAALVRIMKSLILVYARVGKPSRAQQYLAFCRKQKLITAREELALLFAAPQVAGAVSAWGWLRRLSRYSCLALQESCRRAWGRLVSSRAPR